MRILVTHPQVPFAHGGAEVLAERLTEELNARGHDAALVTVPFKWYPPQRLLTNALAWRLLDLDEVEGRKVDLLIATKFPSYAVRHPNKRVWLVHQFRQAYELDRTDLGEFGESAVERATRRKIHELDRRTLGEARKLFAISRNVADRLERSLGLEAEVVCRRRRSSTTAATRTRTSCSPSAASIAPSVSTSCSRRRPPSPRCASWSPATAPTASGSSTLRTDTD